MWRWRIRAHVVERQNHEGLSFPRLAFSPDETHTSWASRLAAFHTGGGVEAFLHDLRVPLLAFFRGHPECV